MPTSTISAIRSGIRTSIRTSKIIRSGARIEDPAYLRIKGEKCLNMYFPLVLFLLAIRSRLVLYDVYHGKKRLILKFGCLQICIQPFQISIKCFTLCRAESGKHACVHSVESDPAVPGNMQPLFGNGNPVAP